MAARTKFSALTMVVIGLGPAACFDSDELRSSNDESESSAAETVAIYNDDTADSSDDNWTAEDTGPGEITCGDAIECLVMCQSIQIFDPDPIEPDFSCFFECDGGLSVEEAYKLITLAECIGIECAKDPDGDGPAVAPCGAESTDTDCLICVAGMAQDPQPPGCLEEAAACD